MQKVSSHFLAPFLPFVTQSCCIVFITTLIFQHHQNGCDEIYMYDSAIYNKLDKSKFKAEYKNGVTPLNPGENFIIRPLCISDYDKGD